MKIELFRVTLIALGGLHCNAHHHRSLRQQLAVVHLEATYGLKRAPPPRRLLEVKRAQIVKLRTHVSIGVSAIEHAARGVVVSPRQAGNVERNISGVMPIRLSQPPPICCG